MNWLDRFPTVWLVALAVWMAVAPVTPEPHLVEKLKMLFAGTLTRPLALLGLKLWRRRAARPAASAGAADRQP